LMAGNRVGKTFCGAAEMACHLTGRYPEWWEGRRFARPIKAWAGNDTSLNTRDIVQSKLCGPYGVEALQGSGAIPKDAVNWHKDVSMARGVSDAYDTVLVRHAGGQQSILTFKSYEQGRKKWQGEAVDVIWYDEEPPTEIYSEGTARLAPTVAGEERGIEYLTFTPLEGKTEVVRMFLEEDSPDRGVVYMGLDDAEHISPEERERTIRSYRPHEREARTKGTPLMGSGRVFQAPEDVIREEAMAQLPRHWPKLWSIDFGGGEETGHPFAAVLEAWDRDADAIHVIHAFRTKDGRPMDHAKAMKPWGADIPVAWPRDGKNREIGSGLPLSKYYRDEGLMMLPDHATFPDGSVSTEAGVQEMDDRMTTGRYKVAAHLGDWFEEYRNYYRKDGKIIKIRDDIMSASRIGVMAKRFARISGEKRAPIRAVSSYRPGEGRRDVYRRRSAA
jgi:phage terminase large subunit-like protein